MNKYIDKIINLFTEKTLEEPAKSAFHQWITEEDSLTEKETALFRVWENTDNTPTEDTIVSLSSLLIKHQSQTERKNKTLQIFRYAAAVALLVFVSSILIYNTKNVPEPAFVEYYSHSKQTERLILSDGSIVLLNTGSLILYPNNYGKKTRTIYLMGEANFKVAKNEAIPFIVKSKNFSVTALGTEFNVSAYSEDNYFKTTLISGSIKVQQNNHSSSYVLEPNEQFVYDDVTKKHAIESIDLYDATAWQRDELVFNKATLVEVFNVLERQYDVSFQYNSEIFNNDKYNFRFKKHSSISCIMDIIMEVADGFTYKKIGDSYRITGKNKALQ